MCTFDSRKLYVCVCVCVINPLKHIPYHRITGCESEGRDPLEYEGVHLKRFILLIKVQKYDINNRMFLLSNPCLKTILDPVATIIWRHVASLSFREEPLTSPAALPVSSSYPRTEGT